MSVVLLSYPIAYLAWPVAPCVLCSLSGALACGGGAGGAGAPWAHPEAERTHSASREYGLVIGSVIFS